MNIRIKGGRLVDPANGLDVRKDVYISQAEVAAIGDAPADFHVDHTVDASGLIVCPGLVDVVARLRSTVSDTNCPPPKGPSGAAI